MFLRGMNGRDLDLNRRLLKMNRLHPSGNAADDVAYLEFAVDEYGDVASADSMDRNGFALVQGMKLLHLKRRGLSVLMGHRNFIAILDAACVQPEVYIPLSIRSSDHFKYQAG